MKYIIKYTDYLSNSTPEYIGKLVRQHYPDFNIAWQKKDATIFNLKTARDLIKYHAYLYGNDNFTNQIFRIIPTRSKKTSLKELVYHEEN